ncbi:MAG: hypothetical protein AAF750_12255 [Planctomycetota bacterium]
MAKETPETKKFATLLSKAQNAYKQEHPDAMDPMLQLVHAFLMWNATRDEADAAIDAIVDDVIDLNELRITYEDEIIALIGEDYPDPSQRVSRLKQSLNEVFFREHDWKMNSITDKPKKDQRAYLDTLPGMTPYAAASVMLICFGGHALPVDDKLLALLHANGALPDTIDSPGAAESFLLRQIKAGDALLAHYALQHWADGQDFPQAPAEKPAKAPAKSSKKTSTKKKTTTTKKTTKKKTTKKKTTKKKTTKKKSSAK